MHPLLDDQKVNGLLVSLGFVKLKGVYARVETPEEDKGLLQDILDDFIPDFTSRGIYKPNRKGITLTRTLSEGSFQYVADT